MSAAALTLAKPSRRTLYRVLGYGFAGLGAVGIMLPLLPTTGPWILAVWCLIKGGDPMASKLLDHPRFGRALRSWFEHGAPSRKGKTAASAGMAMAVLLLRLSGVGGFLFWALAALLAGFAAWLWSRPSA